MELHLDIKTGDLHIGDKYVIKHGMTRKELLAQEGIEKLFYNNGVYDVYNEIDAIMHTFEDRGHSVCMKVGFDYIEEHPEDARIYNIRMKLDDATSRIAQGVGLMEYMDIEDGYVDYMKILTGKTDCWFDCLIRFIDVKGSVLIEKTMQAPDLTINYKYPEE